MPAVVASEGNIKMCRGMLKGNRTYLDTGVLPENTPLVKYIRDVSGVFSISSLEDIDDVISRFFTAVCAWEVVCLYNNNNNIRLNHSPPCPLSRRCEFYVLVARTILFLPLKNKIHNFSSPCNTSLFRVCYVNKSEMAVRCRFVDFHNYSEFTL